MPDPSCIAILLCHFEPYVCFTSMLHHLSIRNIVLIDAVDLSLAPGLGVLTGETGAGKSILLDALGFVLGGRGNARLLRHNAPSGTVTASFDVTGNEAAQNLLKSQGLEITDDTLILRRSIYPDGKSKAFVNDIPVSVNYLRQLGDNLVEVHGQHDQRGLLEPSSHRFMVDAYGRLEGELQTVQSAFDAYDTAVTALEQLKQLRDQAVKEESYLRYVQQELAALAPKLGEEEILAEKRSVLMNREKITSTLQSAMKELQGSQPVVVALQSAGRLLSRNTHLQTPAVQAIIEMLERAAIETNEALEGLEKACQAIEGGGESLESVEERLFALKDAARKYHVPVDELPRYREEVEAKLALLGEQEFRLGTLETEVTASRLRYEQAAATLTKSRRRTAKTLETKLVEELAPLKMEGACFNVAIDVLPEAQWAREGVDRVRFLMSTNPGTPPDELTKIASGGELSRFMLALKVVLASVKSVPTLIFDEIDTGIGGAVADAVGKRLALLGEHAQVLVVTHQPQVAAYGSSHLHVKKHKEQDTTRTSVSLLSASERKQELARMLSGATITSEAMIAAERLLEGV